MSKIGLSLRPFNLKLKHSFGISRGSITYANNVLVTLTFDDLVAYGEAAPSMYYGEDQKSVIEFIQSFAKYKKLEEYLTSIESFKNDLYGFSMRSNSVFSSSARVALEMAFWDLIGKINNKCLYQYFFIDDPFLKNGNHNEIIKPTSFTIGLDNLEVIEEKTKKAINSGFKILKIKLGKDYEHDLRILNAVKKITAGSDCILRIDANGGWDLETTKKMIEILPEYNVEVLEQPLPKGQYKLLPLPPKIPIIVDEDCVSIDDIESVAGKVSGVNIKLMKCGSIIEAFNMINLAKSYNLKIMLGCMIESSCAISAACHLSPLADYIDLDGHLLLEYDPFSGLTLENNRILPSFDTGLGVFLADN